MLGIIPGVSRSWPLNESPSEKEGKYAIPNTLAKSGENPQ